MRSPSTSQSTEEAEQPGRTGRSSPGVLVLAYGCPEQPLALTASGFRRQMELLLDVGCPFIGLPEAGEALLKGALPDGAVCVTVEGGLETVEEPLHWLLSRGATATLFVPASGLGTYAPAHQAPRDLLRGRPAWPRLKSLLRSGATLGCATMSLRDLTVQDEASLRVELFDARRELVEHLGVRVDCLTYPLGRTSRLVAHAAASVGYRWAVSRFPAYLTEADHPMIIPRFRPRDEQELVRLCQGRGGLPGRARLWAFRAKNRLLKK